jgi:nucleolar MIF4G domain-containing protein 1
VAFNDEEDEAYLSHAETDNSASEQDDSEDTSDDDIDTNSESKQDIESESELKTPPATEESVVPVGKYVPPQLRNRQLGNAKEEYIKLQRKTQGLMNKLSENNLETIFQEIEALYRDHPRHGMSDVCLFIHSHQCDLYLQM